MPKKLPGHRQRYGRFLRRRVCQRGRFSKGAVKGWEPRKRDMQAKCWARNPDLDVLMADADAAVERAKAKTEAAQAFFAVADPMTTAALWS